MVFGEGNSDRELEKRGSWFLGLVCSKRGGTVKKKKVAEGKKREFYGERTGKEERCGILGFS